MEAPETQSSEVEFAPLGFLRPNGGKTIDIVKFTLSIWRPLSIGLGCGLGLGVLAYLYLGPTYQADTRVEVAQKSAIPTGERAPNYSGERTEHVHLIMSDAIVQRAVEQHGVKDLPAFRGADDPVKDILDSLTAKRSAGQDNSFVNIIDISYLHPDRKTAGQVVEAIVAAYREYLRDQQNKNSGDLHESLLRRQSDLEEEIARMQTAYHTFRDESPYYLATPPTVTVNGNVVPGKNPYQARVEKIREDIGKNQLRQSEISSRIATLRQLGESGESQEALEFFIQYWLTTGNGSSAEQGGSGGGSLLTESQTKADLDKQYLEMHLLLNRLQLQLGEDHVNVRKLRSQLATLMEFYDQKGFKPPTVTETTAPARGAEPPRSLRVDLVAAYIRIQEQDLVHLEDLDGRLADDLAAAESEAKKASLFEVEDQRRKDEIARKKEQWRTVIAALESFGVRKEQEGYRIEQIAQVRIAKSMKRAIKIVGACGVLGLVLVFGLWYFREWNDMRVKTVDELRQFVGAPILGEVPHFHRLATADKGASGFDPRLCYFHRPGSREAEAYRSVRASLLHTETDGGGRIVQISSPEPGDGKSVSSANLALALAQSGKRVLLIDGDLRRPTIHDLFRIPREIGLADVLRRELDWQNAVRQTQVDGLSLMTSGHCPENPAELLTGSAFAGLMLAVRDEYDVVIIDTPPVLAVSDPSVIAPHTDGMVLVIRLQKNKRGALRRTMETLEAHGAKLFGVVANDIDPSSEDYRSHGYDVYYSQRNDEPQPVAAEPEAELVGR